MATTIYAKDNMETVWVCDECEEVREDGEYDTVYECPECGGRFTREEADGSHRSPCCGKFSAKITDHGCTDCYAELEEAQAVDADGTWVIV